MISKNQLDIAKRYGTYSIPALTTIAYTQIAGNADNMITALTGFVASAVAGIISERRLHKEENRGDEWRLTAQKGHVKLSNDPDFSFFLNTEGLGLNFIAHKYGKFALNWAKKNALKVSETQEEFVDEYKFAEQMGSLTYLAYKNFVQKTTPVYGQNGKLLGTLHHFSLKSYYPTDKMR